LEKSVVDPSEKPMTRGEEESCPFKRKRERK